MEPTGGGSPIADYYPKTVFSKRYPGLAEAVHGFSSATERLCELLAELSDEDLQRPLSAGKWSPAEVADHLVLANRLFTRCVASAGDPSATILSMSKGRLSADGKAIAPTDLEPRPGRNREELIADTRRAAESLLAEGQRARVEKRLDEPCLVQAFFGEMSALECVQLAAWHMVRHVRKLG